MANSDGPFRECRKFHSDPRAVVLNGQPGRDFDFSFFVADQLETMRAANKLAE